MGVAFSPDGRHLATVSGGVLAVPLVATKPGDLMIWDAKDGALIRSVRGHDAPLTAVAYSPDGRTLATSSWDRTVMLWDAETGTRRSTLAGHQDWVCHVVFDHTGNKLATAGADGTVRLWDVASGRSLASFRGHKQSVACVAFDPIDERLASASSDQTVKVWHCSASREALSCGRGPVARLAFFPDSRRLILARNPEESDGRIVPTLTVLDIATGQASTLGSANTGPADTVNGVAVNPSGNLVAAAYADQRAELRDAASGTVLVSLLRPDVEFQTATFSPDHTALVLVGLAPVAERGERLGGERRGGYLGVWDLSQRRARWERISGETNKIRGADVSPDGRLIATADNEESVTLWSAADGIPIRSFRGHRRLVSWVCFSRDGRQLASASWDQTAKVWDVETGQAVATLRGHMRSVLCVAFSPDGTRLGTGSDDQTVKLWDAATGEEVLTLRGHTGVVSSVAFSPDGRLLASASADGVVQVREAEPLGLDALPSRRAN
jgi:WD40 repeat protein